MSHKLLQDFPRSEQQSSWCSIVISLSLVLELPPRLVLHNRETRLRKHGAETCHRPQIEYATKSSRKLFVGSHRVLNEWALWFRISVSGVPCGDCYYQYSVTSTGMDERRFLSYRSVSWTEWLYSPPDIFVSMPWGVNSAINPNTTEAAASKAKRRSSCCLALLAFIILITL